MLVHKIDSAFYQHTTHYDLSYLWLSTPRRSRIGQTTLSVMLFSKPLAATERDEEEEEEEEGTCLTITSVSFHVPLNCGVISPHLLLSRWGAPQTRIDTAHLHLHTARRLRRSLFTTLFSLLPLIISLSLSICLVNMCKQTAWGIDKTHPGGFISTSSSQNITPPPLKLFHQ